jgi:hypothetical protein
VVFSSILSYSGSSEDVVEFDDQARPIPDTDLITSGICHIRFTETLLLATYPTIQRYRLNFYDILTSVGRWANLVGEVDGNYRAGIVEYQVSINDNFRQKTLVKNDKFQFF